MSKMWGWKSWVGACAFALLGVSVAEASSALSDRGSLMILIGMSQADRANLDQGRMKVGQPLPLEISFTVPQLGNFQPQGKARFELRPIDSSFQLGQGIQSKSLPVEDSSHVGGITFEVPFAGAKPLSRISVPMSWVPKGKLGSGFFVRVTVDSPVLRSFGQASFHVTSSGADGALKESTPWKMFEAQQHVFSKLKGRERGDQLTSETVGPFDPTLFKDSLQTDSLEIREEGN